MAFSLIDCVIDCPGSRPLVSSLPLLENLDFFVRHSKISEFGAGHGSTNQSVHTCPKWSCGARGCESCTCPTSSLINHFHEFSSFQSKPYVEWINLKSIERKIYQLNCYHLENNLLSAWWLRSIEPWWDQLIRSRSFGFPELPLVRIDLMFRCFLFELSIRANYMHKYEVQMFGINTNDL